MTVFDDDLDLRGCMVRLRGDGKRPAPVLAIPTDAERKHVGMCVLYGWGNRTGRAHDHYAHIAFQNTCHDTDDVPKASSSRDIVEVLPAEPSDANAPPPEECGMPDLRGMTVQLRGDGDGKGLVVTIPAEATLRYRPHYYLYDWGYLHGRTEDWAYTARQCVWGHDETNPLSRRDIVAILENPDAEEPEPNAQPEPDGTQPYKIEIEAGRYDLIPLDKIAAELTTPYAEVKWGEGEGQSCVIASAGAVLRGRRAAWVAANGGGKGSLVFVNREGQVDTANYGTVDMMSTPGWHGPKALDNAAAWWAEVRRREAITVVATVTPIAADEPMLVDEDEEEDQAAKEGEGYDRAE